MRRRSFPPFVALLCLVVSVSRAGAADRLTARDWKTHPAIVEIDTKHDVYAVGDVHGDYERLVTLLVAGKIIPADPGSPEKVRWRAGKAVLICTGDLINKWNQSLPVIALFRALQVEAAKAGGRVVVTLGNHEAEFLAQPRKKKSADFDREIRARGLKPEVVAAGNDALGIGEWLRSLPAAARINDWFFAHAGNTHNRTLAQLRDDLERGIDRSGFKAPVLVNGDSLLEARMHPHPWWEKPGDSVAQSKHKLAQGVQALGVKHLVIGHQPGKVTFAGKATRPAGELAQHFEGLIFLIDTGMSRGVGDSTGALLHIQHGKKPRAFRIRASGQSQEIWAAP